jgi:hypothetical protein
MTKLSYAAVSSPSIPAAFTRQIFKAQNQVRNIYFLFDFIMGGLLSFYYGWPIKFRLLSFLGS